MRHFSNRCWAPSLLLLAGLGAVPAQAGAAGLVDEEHQVYLAEPVVTEPAWTQTSVYLRSMLFDIPGAVSRPSPQVGFAFVPGVTWQLFDLLELDIALPLVLNPDVSGNRDLEAYRQMKTLHPDWPGPDNYDAHPDFDMPGLRLGAKVGLLGRKAADRLFLAAGLNANLPVFEQWGTNIGDWKTTRFTSSPLLVTPYLVAAYALGRFSPQLQLGASLRVDQAVDPETGYFLRDAAGQVNTDWHGDLLFNLALPLALPYERTVLMVEINGAWNFHRDLQLFITPAVTFLPRSSAASLAFACMIPVADGAFRGQEGFRFLVFFRYRLDMLSLGGEDDFEQEAESEQLPPAGW